MNFNNIWWEYVKIHLQYDPPTPNKHLQILVLSLKLNYFTFQ